jgi:hypothetical protein
MKFWIGLLVALRLAAFSLAQEYVDDYGQQQDTLYHDYAARQEGKAVAHG